MKVGLFDLYSSGHHLPYAEIVRNALVGTGECEINFITLTSTERQFEIFDRENIVFLDGVDAPKIEDRSGDFSVIADKYVSMFASQAAKQEYDLVHFLYVDDILGALHQHWSGVQEITTIGDIVGPFFTRGTPLRRKYTHPAALKILRSPLSHIVDAAVPAEPSHQMLWRDLLLYRCLSDAVFDCLLVHSEEAETYVQAFEPKQTIKNISFPVPDNYTGFSKEEARRHLDLPQSETILLFFGTLRADKGIHVLLDAVRSYGGPEFTLVIAGPAVAIDEEEISSASEDSIVDIKARLKFVTEPALYYRAADFVVMPYEYDFGKENMSMIFHEACGSLRPVITSDFGTLGRLVREWNLGTTFEQGSPESLATTISAALTGKIDFSEEQMQTYARQFSTAKIHDRIANIYKNQHSNTKFNKSVKNTTVE